MKYILNKSLAKDLKPELCASRSIYYPNRDKREELENCSCNGTFKCGDYCEEFRLDLQAFQKCEYEKTVMHELLRTRMFGGLA